MRSVLRERRPPRLQLELWEDVFPALKLDPELAVVDQALDDDRFFAPYREKFSRRVGRPSVPIETYLRMMYLKFRHHLSYRDLVRAVDDSFQWRRFCRLDLVERVPDDTTLVKITRRCGPETVEELNRALLQVAMEKKVVRGRKVRIDTTVTEANIEHPSEAGLLADGVETLTREVGKLQQAGVAPRTGFRDRTRAVKKRIQEIGRVLRRRTGEGWSEVDRVTKKMVRIAEEVVRQARHVLDNARRSRRLGRQPQLQHRIENLRAWLPLVERVIAQAREVVSGNRHIPDRLISLFDPDARPIRRGKQDRPTEFGYKVRLDEAENGFVAGYEVLVGNPPDNTLVDRVISSLRERLGRAPREVATDRGFHSAANERTLHEAGVVRVSLPHRGKKGPARVAHERRSWFRRLQRWRAGQEATISLLKRRFGLDRTLSRGHAGARTWIGLGILAHNLWRVARTA